MAIQTTYKLVDADGNPVDTTFQQWISTLSIDEQKEFFDAQIRQDEIIQNRMDEGILVKNSQNTTVWSSRKAERTIKHDPVWKEYWDRWLEVHDYYVEFERTEL